MFHGACVWALYQPVISLKLETIHEEANAKSCVAANRNARMRHVMARQTTHSVNSERRTAEL